MEQANSIKYWQLIEEIGACNNKWQESLAIKARIIDNLIGSLTDEKEILFVSFNPLAAELAKKYTVTVVCDTALLDLFQCNNCIAVSDIANIKKKFPIVIALDEYFTYCKNEHQQRKLITDVAQVTDGWLITTLQDYKNYAPHKKNQIDAVTISGQDNYIVLENSIADKTDKQLWDHYWYCIKDNFNLLTIGPVKRHTMYFKQMAKYSSDADSKQYVIQKNLLYKGFFSKSFEHIITVNF
jgi:hypothetical protein